MERHGDEPDMTIDHEKRTARQSFFTRQSRIIWAGPRPGWCLLYLAGRRLARSRRRHVHPGIRVKEIETSGACGHARNGGSIGCRVHPVTHRTVSGGTHRGVHPAGIHGWIHWRHHQLHGARVHRRHHPLHVHAGVHGLHHHVHGVGVHGHHHPAHHLAGIGQLGHQRCIEVRVHRGGHPPHVHVGFGKFHVVVHGARIHHRTHHAIPVARLHHIDAHLGVEAGFRHGIGPRHEHFGVAVSRCIAGEVSHAVQPLSARLRDGLGRCINSRCGGGRWGFAG